MCPSIRSYADDDNAQQGFVDVYKPAPVLSAVKGSARRCAYCLAVFMPLDKMLREGSCWAHALLEATTSSRTECVDWSQQGLQPD